MQLRTTLTALAAVAMLAASSVAQTTSGTVSSNETWSGTVTLTGDVIISGGTVTVSPGTQIKMATTNDNIVNGTASRINIVITGTGALVAEGSATQPITFTTSSLFPAKGAWGRIDVMGLSNGNATSFKHCNFLYGQTPIEMRNPPGSSAYTVLTLENCLFSNTGASALYFTSGGELTITDCRFFTCGKGVFVHGGSSTTISGSYFNKMSCAIINAGLDGVEEQSMSIDHCTFYDIDMMLAGTNPKWWDGYGIFNTTNGVSLTGAMTLTNTIMVQATLAGMVVGGWTVNRNNNCWYTGMMGLANIEDASPGTGSIEQDPMFVNAAAGNYSLDALSPCIDAASDGTNMGAWQDGDSRVTMSGGTEERVNRFGNLLVNGTVRFESAEPFAAATELGVFTVDGAQVASVDVPAGARSAEWTPGSGVQAGTYLYRLDDAQGMLIVTD